MSEDDSNRNILAVSDVLEEYQNLLRGEGLPGKKGNLEDEIQRIEGMKNTLETPILREQLGVKLMEEKNLKIGPLEVNRGFVAIFGGLALMISSIGAMVKFEEKGYIKLMF